MAASPQERIQTLTTVLPAWLWGHFQVSDLLRVASLGTSSLLGPAPTILAKGRPAQPLEPMQVQLPMNKNPGSWRAQSSGFPLFL